MYISKLYATPFYNPYIRVNMYQSESQPYTRLIKKNLRSWVFTTNQPRYNH